MAQIILIKPIRRYCSGQFIVNVGYMLLQSVVVVLIPVLRVLLLILAIYHD